VGRSAHSSRVYSGEIADPALEFAITGHLGWVDMNRKEIAWVFVTNNYRDFTLYIGDARVSDGGEGNGGALSGGRWASVHMPTGRRCSASKATS